MDRRKTDFPQGKSDETKNRQTSRAWWLELTQYTRIKHFGTITSKRTFFGTIKILTNAFTWERSAGLGEGILGEKNRDPLPPNRLPPGPLLSSP